MNRILKNRLLLQLLFTMAAAVSVAVLSAVLISDAIGSAESVVVGEANQAIFTALREMNRQYQYGASYDSSWQTLPVRARDVSLRGISQTVLRSYTGVEGGFYSDASLLGYAYPSHDTGLAKTDVPSAESGLILSTVQESLKTNRAVSRVVRGRSDLLVLGAFPNQKRGVATWAMKRLAGQAASGFHQREIKLAVLVLAALLSITGTLATGLSMARGIERIQRGLLNLEKDFAFRLPEQSHELGGIIRSINRMASVRGKLEAELRREDRLRALGRLAAGLAHEIRNPLNSIALTVQMLERKAETHSVQRDDLRTVRSEVTRLNTLLTDLLNLQRSREPQPEKQPILPIVHHCISLVKKQAEMQHTQILLDAPNAGVCALCDSNQLTQAIVNLLLNALESSPEGGTVHVRVHQTDGKASVAIEDQGTGLDPEQQEHLFEPFYTTKAAGSGLGLAVSRELMRSQGADVLYAPYSTGARFIVELPQA